MNENRGARRAWTPEEKAALLAAVEQCRATGGRLDWHAIVATIPGRGARSAQSQFYTLRPARTPVRIRVPSAPVAVPSVLRRLCLRCRRPFDSLDRKRNWICGSCNERIAQAGSAVEYAAHAKAA